MIDQNTIFSQLDSRVESRYNQNKIDQISSIILADNKILYFRNGIPIVEYKIKIVGNLGTIEMLIEEFEFDKKLI